MSEIEEYDIMDSGDITTAPLIRRTLLLGYYRISLLLRYQS